MGITIAVAPHGWTKVVEGGWIICDVDPHTKIFHKTSSHGKRMLLVQNPSSVSIPLILPNGEPLVIPRGCYFKEVPFLEEEMTEEDKFFAEVYEEWYGEVDQMAKGKPFARQRKTTGSFSRPM